MAFSSLNYRSFVVGVSAVAMLFAIASPASAHHGHSLSGKGTIQISDVMTCGSDTCYSVTANFPPGGSQNISSTVTGQGMTATSTCKGKSSKSCCMTTMNLSITFDEGSTEVATLDCAFVGKQCDKPAESPTSETLKGKLICTDGTGQLQGQTGTGKLSADPSPSTGDGPVSASIHVK